MKRYNPIIAICGVSQCSRLFMLKLDSSFGNTKGIHRGVLGHHFHAFCRTTNEVTLFIDMVFYSFKKNIYSKC